MTQLEALLSAGISTAIVAGWAYFTHIHKVHSKRIDQVNTDHSQEMAKLNEDHTRAISRLNEDHWKAMISVSEKYASEMKDITVESVGAMNRIAGLIENNNKLLDRVIFQKT